MVFDGISIKKMCVDLWNYNFVIRSGVIREYNISANVSQTDSGN